MVKMYDLQGKHAGDAELPAVFKVAYRPDVIKRAVLALQSQARQPYGTDVLAGKRTSAHYHGTRHMDSRQQMMNREMARMPRIHGKSAGNQAWRARFVPQAEGGREAHPPKSEKIWSQKVNKKERILAIRSALAATTMPDLMKKRGHTFTASLPLVIVDDFENMKKTKEVVSLLVKIGLVSELERVSAPRKVRAGKGKMRGRKYRSKKGFLVIASKQCDALKACRNIRGADAVHPEELTAEHLAPGCQAGRLLIVTKSALAELQKRFGE